MSKIKNGGLDQYSAEPFERQQFGTAGVEGVNVLSFKVDLINSRQLCTCLDTVTDPVNRRPLVSDRTTRV